MPTQRKAPFKIHVDPSCLSNSTNLAMSPERNTSNTTVVRHDSWSEDAPDDPEPEANAETEHVTDTEQEARERQIDRIEAQIQAAARAVVASIEKDRLNGNEDSVLSMQTDDSYEPEGTELTYDGTDLTYGSETAAHEDHNGIDVNENIYASDNEEDNDHEMDNSEMISDSGNEEVSELNQDLCTSELDYDSDHENVKTDDDNDAEAEHHDITPQAEVVQSIEHDDSAVKPEPVEELRPQSLEEPDQAKIDTAADEVPSTLDNDQGGDSSSHHDGDIDDDVFSHNSSRSARSSLNSYEALQSGEEKNHQMALTSPFVGEEANTRRESDAISRIPSSGSYMHPIPDAVQQTPSKVLSRPPFRTPSSVRAMQMSSPTPSIYNSPRSIKRHLPTVSRIGTPTSHSSKTRTPTRFKPKKEQPLVLLHVTVLPLHWIYSHLMQAPELPNDLHYVKENWRLLQEKLGDTVLERGILLPHPQDSFEVLEERLLEALELPVRPRACILKCGHYMGPIDSEAPSSDDEGGSFWNENMTRRRWCDICRKDVRLGNNSEPEGKRFRVKIFASNGLMHAGAWAAAWKEMERVDVEIGPWVEPYQHTELERMAMLKPQTIIENNEDEFEDEENLLDEDQPDHHDEEPPLENKEDNDRGIHSDGTPDVDVPEGNHHSGAGDTTTEPPEPEKSVADYENEMRELLLEEEQMRVLHERQSAIPQRSPSPMRRKPRSIINEDSLSELLVAAFKVAMRDRKNIAIIVLSVLVLVLALRPGMVPSTTIPTSSSQPTSDASQDNVPPLAIKDTIASVANVISETLAVASNAIVGTPTPAAMKQQKPLRTSKQMRKPPAKPRGSVPETVQTAESSASEMKENPVLTETAETGRGSPCEEITKAQDENSNHSRDLADIAESGNDESDPISELDANNNNNSNAPPAVVPNMELNMDSHVDSRSEGDEEATEIEAEEEEEDAENSLTTLIKEQLEYLPEAASKIPFALKDSVEHDTD
jgi:hypothetical protein